MTDQTTPFCAAVDWGTSSLRVWVLAADGTILGERRSGEGMQAAGEPGFGAVLEGHLDALGVPAGLPAIVCGMAGARQGWVEAPYVATPADLAEIARAAIRVPGIARDVRILPGVAQYAAGRQDVMRGEETQVMGLQARGEAVICLPGTHSKWVVATDGRIESFSTFMTGEVFALLAGQSILRHAVGAGGEVLAEAGAFADGVKASLAGPEMILNRMFSLRADGLFGRASAAEARSRLSGMVLGLEIAGARSIYGGRSVVLAASGTLLALYRAALPLAGFSIEEADADAAVRRGLLAAALQCFGTAGVTK